MNYLKDARQIKRHPLTAKLLTLEKQVVLGEGLDLPTQFAYIPGHTRLDSCQASVGKMTLRCEYVPFDNVAIAALESEAAGTESVQPVMQFFKDEGFFFAYMHQAMLQRLRGAFNMLRNHCFRGLA